jgi:hypothetical protein
MAIWDAVSRTNPANTKRVNQRGGFTAINAQSQIMEATRQFGPVGIGWGYECGEITRMDNMVIVPVTLWHGERANSFGPVFGCAEMFGQRVDHDAPKKAMTDAITKGLSQLGFNADVFLGLYDDNKYVEAARREFAGQPVNGTPVAAPAPSTPEASETLKQLRRTLAECTSEQECKAWLKKHIDAINMLDEHERVPLEREYVGLKAGFGQVSRLAA